MQNAPIHVPITGLQELRYMPIITPIMGVKAALMEAMFVEADAMEQADAEQAVKRLLYLYQAGRLAPLPFFPKAS